MKTKSQQPTVNHIAFRDELLTLLNKHSGHLDAAELLALSAYTTGQILAMMDARKWTSELAMEVVIKNIEAGNTQAIADAAKWMGSA
jgi:hypothetical protein